MKSDILTKQQIEKALKSNKLLNESDIVVNLLNGNVLLTGSVDSYPKRELAKKIAKEVQGVKTATEEIVVKLPESGQCSDNEIESGAIQLFIKNLGNSHNDIKIIVNKGKVRLEGILKWKYQKDLAEQCITGLKGITDIKNNIAIPDKLKSGIDEKDVFAAIYGDPSITTEIKIEIIGNRVVLKGKVLTIEQKNLVTSLVRNVPNVQEVENFLMVERIC